MSRSGESVSVESDGVSITKTVDDTEYESLAVVLNIRSDIEGPIEVTVIDTVPDSVRPDDIRFFSEYGGQHWEVGPDELTFTRTVVAGEETTAVYGIEGFDRDDSELLTEPSIQIDDEDADARSPTTSMENPSDADELVEGAGDAKAVSEYEDGDLAKIIAEEFRSETIASEDRKLLQEELLPGNNGNDARIKHLQRQVADLESYTAALESFLDEDGGAEAVIHEFGERVDDLSDEVREIQETMSQVRGDVKDLEARLNDVDESVDEVETEVTEISADLDDVSGQTETIEEDARTLEGDLEQLESLDQKIESLEDDLDAMEDRIADFAALRDRLSSMFGPSDEENPTQTDVDSDKEAGEEDS